MSDPTLPQRHAATRLRDEGRHITIDGDLWVVYERPPEQLDRRQSPSLVFECRTAIRRVRDYPPDWRELGDDELARLSWSR